MTDLNDDRMIERLKSIYRTESGKLLMDYVMTGLPELSDIDDTLPAEELKAQVKATNKTREHLLNKIQVLTSPIEEGD